MAQVFISYAREDRPTAEKLARVLETRGWSTWWDAHLQPGQIWDEIIEQELAAARCVVVLWSGTSKVKRFVKLEAEDALNRHILVPALIEDVTLPFKFRDVQAEPLFDWSGDLCHPGLIRILATINQHLKGTSGEADQTAPATAREGGVPPKATPKKLKSVARARKKADQTVPDYGKGERFAIRSTSTPIHEEQDIPVVKVFIASSQAAIALAQKLSNLLTHYSSNEFRLVAVMRWKYSEGYYPFPLDALVQLTRECDFAVFLLTESDIDSPGENRDNCIYEAGFFMRALGNDSRRCFLVVPCAQHKLPSDFAHLTYISIVPREQEIEWAATLILRAIAVFAREDKLRALRGVQLRTVTFRELIRRERPETDGGLLRGLAANVVVQDGLFEVNIGDAAKRIRTNLIDHFVEYFYVFEASLSEIHHIAHSLLMLAGAEGLDTLADTFSEIRESLQIHLVPDRRGGGIKYRIYNARDPAFAICYVLAPRFVGATLPADFEDYEWIEWARGYEAVAIADEMYRICVPAEKDRVFRSSIYYDLYKHDDLLKVLRRELYLELRKLSKGDDVFMEKTWRVLLQACFGDAHERSSQTIV